MKGSDRTLLTGAIIGKALGIPNAGKRIMARRFNPVSRIDEQGDVQMRGIQMGLVGLHVMLLAVAATAQNTFPATGNVGIGTTSPAYPLDVNGAVRTSSASGYRFGTNNNTFVSEGNGPQIGTGGNTGSTGAKFLNSNGTSIMLVRSDGYVGVETPTPATAFTISGAGDPNPNNSSQRYYANGGLTFQSSGGYVVGQVAAVKESGYYVDRGDLSFLVGQGGGYEKEMMRLVGSTGNVGIGTATPGAALEVAGNVKLTAASGASITYQDGSVQTVAWNGVLGGGDYAESVDVIGDRAQYEPGDVLVIDPSSKGRFMKSTVAYSTAVIGIYSTRPGVVGRRQLSDRPHMKEEVPMAMIGVVPTKVSAESGAIRAGDLLVTSSKPGYAMKGADRAQLTGAIISKALEPLDAGLGVIEVAVSIQ